MSIYKEKGIIFDIQKFSVHDGPGIRTIVFLKGCPLRCKWCCNPESQSTKIEAMKTADGEKIVGREAAVGEIIQEVLKDRAYFRRSGGGITLSGGECLLQSDFSAALLKAAKEAGINTAIESTAFSSFENIEKLLPFLDLFLMDIKHISSGKHREFTGQPNELILENARKIAESGVPLTIRVPVIPGFNDTTEEISQIAEFAAELKGVSQIHLLPYHRLGEDKYKDLNREYFMKDITPPTDEKMESLKSAAEHFGLKCQIGG